MELKSPLEEFFNHSSALRFELESAFELNKLLTTLLNPLQISIWHHTDKQFVINALVDLKHRMVLKYSQTAILGLSPGPHGRGFWNVFNHLVKHHTVPPNVDLWNVGATAGLYEFVNMWKSLSKREVIATYYRHK